MRKDWRTNDIAWGHADGLCQIVKVLLADDPAWERITQALKDPARKETLLEAFSQESLLDAFACGLASGADPRDIPGLPEQCEAAHTAIKKLAKDSTNKKARKRFMHALIHAGAVSTMGQYVQQIIDDTQEQNDEWRWKEGPTRHRGPKKNALDQIVYMKLGNQPVERELPLSLIVQYCGHVGLLLLGLLAASFRPGTAARKTIDSLGKYARPVFWLAYQLGGTLRTERASATVIVFSLGIGLVAFGLGASFAGSVGLAVLGFVLAFVVVWLQYRVVRSKLWTVVSLLLVAGIAAFYASPAGTATRESVGGALVSVGTWVRP